jgi:hypothetical protein
MENFKARSHASASFLSNSAAKIFTQWAIFGTSAPENLVSLCPGA